MIQYQPKKNNPRVCQNSSLLHGLRLITSLFGRFTTQYRIRTVHANFDTLSWSVKTNNINSIQISNPEDDTKLHPIFNRHNTQLWVNGYSKSGASGWKYTGFMVFITVWSRASLPYRGEMAHIRRNRQRFSQRRCPAQVAVLSEYGPAQNYRSATGMSFLLLCGQQ